MHKVEDLARQASFSGFSEIFHAFRAAVMIENYSNLVFTAALSCPSKQMYYSVVGWNALFLFAHMIKLA